MIFSVFCLEDIRLSGRESVAESDYEVHVILCRWSLSVILAIISGLLCGHLSYLYTNLYKMTYHNVPIVEPLMVSMDFISVWNGRELILSLYNIT